MKKKLLLIVLTIVMTLSMAIGVVGCATPPVADCKHPEFNEWTVKTPATCLATGIKTAKCKTCSYVKEEVIPLAEHKYSAWTVQEGGVYEERHCTENGCTEQETRLFVDEFYATVEKSFAENKFITLNNVAIPTQVEDEFGNSYWSVGYIIDTIQISVGTDSDGKFYLYAYATLPSAGETSEYSNCYIVVESDSAYLLYDDESYPLSAIIPFDGVTAQFDAIQSFIETNIQLPENIKNIIDGVVEYIGNIDFEGIAKESALISGKILEVLFAKEETEDGYTMSFNFDYFKQINNDLYSKDLATLLGEDTVAFIKLMPSFTVGDLLDFVFNPEYGIDIDLFTKVADVLGYVLMAEGDFSEIAGEEMVTDGLFDRALAELLLEGGFISQIEVQNFTFKGLVENKTHPFMTTLIADVLKKALDMDETVDIGAQFGIMVDMLLEMTPYEILVTYLSNGPSTDGPGDVYALGDSLDINVEEQTLFVKQRVDEQIDVISETIIYNIITNKDGKALKVEFLVMIDGEFTESNGMVIDFVGDTDIDFEEVISTVEENFAEGKELLANQVVEKGDNLDLTVEDYQYMLDENYGRDSLASAQTITDDKGNLIGIKISALEIRYESEEGYFLVTKSSFDVKLDECVKEKMGSQSYFYLVYMCGSGSNATCADYKVTIDGEQIVEEKIEDKQPLFSMAMFLCSYNEQTEKVELNEYKAMAISELFPGATDSYIPPIE